MTKLERLIFTFPPVTFLMKKSKHWHLPGFEGVPLYDVVKFFYRQVRKVGLTERASAISYNFIMAMPPTFLFLFTLLPKLPFLDKKNLLRQLHSLVNDIIPAQGYNKNILAFIDSFFKETKIGLISFGFILALFFASNAMIGIMRSFNKDHYGFEKRVGLKRRWTAIKLTSILLGLVLACLLLLITQGIVLKWMGVRNHDWRQVIFYLRWVFIVALIFYSFAFIYKYAPAAQKRWQLLSPGSILAATLSILASLGFSAFVNNYGKYDALYGAIGTIIFLMTLIYINSLVLLIGFELNVSIKSLRSVALKREAEEKINSPKG
ncbi:MAG: YihY/virulence factor BrkB family protein [Ferruginibacter sp.]